MSNGRNIDGGANRDIDASADDTRSTDAGSGSGGTPQRPGGSTGMDAGTTGLDAAVQQADAGFDGSRVDATTQPCNCTAPQYACGTTRWIDTQAYCGDTVRLECIITGYPPGGPATVEVLHPTTGAVVDTIATNLNGGRVDASWIAKAQTANWRNDRMRFRVTVASIGVTCTSSNEFRFRQRPTTNWIRIDEDHAATNGFSPVVELYDSALEASRVHHSLKIKLSGDGLSAAAQTSAKATIQRVWNGGFSGWSFHRTRCRRGSTCDCAFDCCKASYRLDVNFVTASENVEISITRVAAGGTPGISSTGRTGTEWFDPPLNAASTYAHETGHLLGQFDEYPTGGNDPSGVQPADSPVDNLMSTSGNTTLLKRHYRRPLAFLNDHSGGDPYETIP